MNRMNDYVGREKNLMSNAYKCDRCGELFCSQVTNRKYYITNRRNESTYRADLCDECQKQLDYFMKNKCAISIPIVDESECEHE